ncbi:hypothetical protein [Geoglobus sp.]
MEIEEIRQLADMLRDARFHDGKVEVDVDVLDALLKVLGRAVAEIDMGNVYTAREILSEVGEEIFRALKSFLNEH